MGKSESHLIDARDRLAYLDYAWPRDHPQYRGHYAALRRQPDNWHELQRRSAYADLHRVRAQLRECTSERLRPKLLDRARALCQHIDRLDDVAELAGLSTAPIPPSDAEAGTPVVDEMLDPVAKSFQENGHRVVEGTVDSAAAAWFLGVERATLRKWRSENRGPACADGRYEIGTLLDYAYWLASQQPTPGRRTAHIETVLARIPSTQDASPQFINGVDGCSITAPARSSDE